MPTRKASDVPVASKAGRKRAHSANASDVPSAGKAKKKRIQPANTDVPAASKTRKKQPQTGKATGVAAASKTKKKQTQTTRSSAMAAASKIRKKKVHKTKSTGLPGGRNTRRTQTQAAQTSSVSKTSKLRKKNTETTGMPTASKARKKQVQTATKAAGGPAGRNTRKKQTQTAGTSDKAASKISKRQTQAIKAAGVPAGRNTRQKQAQTTRASDKAASKTRKRQTQDIKAASVPAGRNTRQKQAQTTRASDKAASKTREKQTQITNASDVSASSKSRKEQTKAAQTSSSDVRNMRILLVGKTGVGKSSLGNTLLGRDAFAVSTKMKSATERCSWDKGERDRTVLMVTDTPGTWDTRARGQQGTSEDPDRDTEIFKSIAVVAPGPHVVLMVMRCNDVTEDEIDAYTYLKSLFGDDLRKYMMIVFVGLDSYPQQTLDGKIRAARAAAASDNLLKPVLADVNNRVYFVSNAVERPTREQQANGLLIHMQRLMDRNTGSHFTHPVMEQAMDLIKQEVRWRQHTSAEASDDAIRQEISTNQNETLMSKIIAVVKKRFQRAAAAATVCLAEAIAIKIADRFCTIS